MFGLFKRKAEPHQDAMQAIEKYVNCDRQFIRNVRPSEVAGFMFGVEPKVLEAHWERLRQCLASSSEASNALSMVTREFIKYGMLVTSLNPDFIGFLLKTTVFVGDAKPAIDAFMETFCESYEQAARDGRLVTFLDGYFPKDEHLLTDIPRRMRYVEEYVRRWRAMKTKSV
jgi:hypothetical protein